MRWAACQANLDTMPAPTDGTSQIEGVCFNGLDWGLDSVCHCGWSCGDERFASGDFAKFEHPVPDISIFSQMGGSRGFSSGYYHLVERVTLVKVRVEILTKFTRPAGAGIKAAYNSAINVFHGGRLLKGENTVARFV